MNKSAFLTLIKQVSDISDQQQSELEQVAATFPYCQTAHLLLAKSAYDKGSMLSTQRLRRASAYATDRQLLKRLIYASPVLEPAYAEAPEIADTETEQEAAIPVAIQETEKISGQVEQAVPTPAATIQEPTAIPVTDAPESPAAGIDKDTPEAIPEAADGHLHAQAIPEAEAIEEAETLEQAYSHTSATGLPHTPQEELPDETQNPEAELDSELALLFTFSSISSSSTDLLGQRTEDPALAEESEAGHQLAQTAEALYDIREKTEADTELPYPIAPVISDTAIPAATAATSWDAIPDAAGHESVVDGNETEETEAEIQVAAGDAEINYSFDEIDRLYAEDSLGYWMGSSRMGEVLQLKDDYTRPRPQSFHPELILEYSRTHELEKAIQPTRHVLSKQLDIIDQFLKLNPRLKTMANLKMKPEPQEDLSLKSSKIKKGIASESLANIFLKQGKPKKAVKIYEQLILKYPEKKSYFAEQIEKLQNIT